mgnify:CR=1 FL=1
MDDDIYIDDLNLDPKELEETKKIIEQDEDYDDYSGGDSLHFGEFLNETS